MAATTECSCGSGLPFSRCHGDSRNEYARVQALREADSLAWMFPFVRVSGIDPLVEDAAERAGPDEIPDTVVDDVFVQINLAERRRVVDLWAIPWRDSAASLPGQVPCRRYITSLK